MIFTVAKQNAGSPRTFKTPGRLASAIVRAGATEATADDKSVVVNWPEGIVEYPVDKKCNVDAQLAWDMEPTVKS